MFDNEAYPSTILTTNPYRTGSLTETPFHLKGKDWLEATPAERTQLTEAAFFYWRKRGFPHYRLSKRQIQTEFRHLCALDSRRVFVRGELRGSNIGLRLANAYHR